MNLATVASTHPKSFCHRRNHHALPTTTRRPTGHGLIRGGGFRRGPSLPSTVPNPRTPARVPTHASAEFSLDEKVTTADPSTAADPNKSDTFVWEKAWYPVMRTKDILPNTPTAIELLGKRLVVWQSGDGGAFSTVDDACPHKLAPLSLGKVTDDGGIMCRYHGWCFNGSGKCTKIPMATSEARESRICSDKRSAVAAYPTLVKQGLLWIWPDATPEGVEAAAASEPATESGFDSFMTLQQPADYISFTENSFDPSHANFLHEGVGFGAHPYRPETAMPMVDFKLDGKATSSGFKLSHRGYSQGTEGMLATRTFSPPTTLHTCYLTPKGATRTEGHFVPIRPGRTHIFMDFKFAPLTPDEKEDLAAAGVDLEEKTAKKKKSPSPSVLKALKGALDKVVPAWLQEGLRHRASFSFPLGLQDLSVMAGAEVAMKDKPVPWNKAYYLPTPSDQGVVVFRSWIEQFGGGGPFGPGGHIRDGPGHPNEVLQDKWETHTKFCSSCKRTVEFLATVSSWCARLGVACWLGALVASIGRAAPSQVATPLVAVGLLLYAASHALRTFQDGWISGMRPSGNGLPWTQADPWKKKK